MKSWDELDTFDEIDPAVKEAVEKAKADAKANNPFRKMEAKAHKLSDSGEIVIRPWVIPDLIFEGFFTFFAGTGVGKTTSIAPLAVYASGWVEGHELTSPYKRHVIYITEHTEQVEGIIKNNFTQDELEAVDDYFHIWDAKRVDSTQWGLLREVLDDYVHDNVYPLVVIDTFNACIGVTDTNSGSEISTLNATIKQEVMQHGSKEKMASVWTVDHTPKAKDGQTKAGGSGNKVNDVDDYLSGQRAGDYTLFRVHKNRQEGLKFAFYAKYTETVLKNVSDYRGGKSVIGLSKFEFGLLTKDEFEQTAGGTGTARAEKAESERDADITAIWEALSNSGDKPDKAKTKSGLALWMSDVCLSSGMENPPKEARIRQTLWNDLVLEGIVCKQDGKFVINWSYDPDDCSYQQDGGEAATLPEGGVDADLPF